MPGRLPHKEFIGATFDQRVEMLCRIADGHPRLHAATSDGSLMVEIAEDAARHWPGAEVHLLCGRDAAERIFGWHYEDEDAVPRLFRQFRLLVAPRGGKFEAPSQYRHAVQILDMPEWDECSSTVVREAIASGRDWRALVPDAIADAVANLYK